MYHNVIGKTQTQGRMTHVSCFRQYFIDLMPFLWSRGRHFGDLRVRLTEVLRITKNSNKKKNRSTSLWPLG